MPEDVYIPVGADSPFKYQWGGETFWIYFPNAGGSAGGSKAGNSNSTVLPVRLKFRPGGTGYIAGAASYRVFLWNTADTGELHEELLRGLQSATDVDVNVEIADFISQGGSRLLDTVMDEVKGVVSTDLTIQLNIQGDQGGE